MAAARPTGVPARGADVSAVHGHACVGFRSFLAEHEGDECVPTISSGGHVVEVRE